MPGPMACVALPLIWLAPRRKRRVKACAARLSKESAVALRDLIDVGQVDVQEVGNSLPLRNILQVVEVPRLHCRDGVLRQPHVFPQPSLAKMRPYRRLTAASGGTCRGSPRPPSELQSVVLPPTAAHNVPHRPGRGAQVDRFGTKQFRNAWCSPGNASLMPRRGGNTAPTVLQTVTASDPWQACSGQTATQVTGGFVAMTYSPPDTTPDPRDPGVPFARVRQLSRC